MRELSRRDFFNLGRAPVGLDDPVVHIASLLVQATAIGCEAVRSIVHTLPGAELHETGHAGKIVIILESADSRAIANATAELQQLSGVLTVSIVAHLTENASAMEQQHDDEPTTVPAT
jgi:periplasmic nitrate reductase NapD